MLFEGTWLRDLGKTALRNEGKKPRAGRTARERWVSCSFLARGSGPRSLKIRSLTPLLPRRPRPASRLLQHLWDAREGQLPGTWGTSAPRARRRRPGLMQRRDASVLPLCSRNCWGYYDNWGKVKYLYSTVFSLFFVCFEDIRCFQTYFKHKSWSGWSRTCLLSLKLTFGKVFIKLRSERKVICKRYIYVDMYIEFI